MTIPFEFRPTDWLSEQASECRATVGERSSFRICLRDRFGNDCHGELSGESLPSFDITLTDPQSKKIALDIKPFKVRRITPKKEKTECVRIIYE